MANEIVMSSTSPLKTPIEPGSSGAFAVSVRNDRNPSGFETFRFWKHQRTCGVR